MVNVDILSPNIRYLLDTCRLSFKKNLQDSILIMIFLIIIFNWKIINYPTLLQLFDTRLNEGFSFLVL